MSIFSPILQRFVDQAPFAVMARALLENVFAPAKLNALFEEHAVSQSTRQLLFSTAADLLTQVVCGVRPSVHAAYKNARQQGNIAVTVKALYDKLAHVETATSCALVRHTSAEARAVLAHLGDRPPPLLPGYDLRIVDGNHLAATDKRLQVLRDEPRGALPGVVVAVLDPQARLIEDVVLSPDGHAQECVLVEQLLHQVRQRQLWLADRHYCTSAILFGLLRRGAFFLIRQHAGHLRWQPVGQRRRRGRIPTGVVYEQKVQLIDPPTGEVLQARRISIELDEPTRDGETAIHVLSNVPVVDASGRRLAELYLERWQIETAFRDLTVYLECEVNTLGYPPAALLGFCLAVGCYNVLAVLKGAVRAEHGAKAEEELSTYYLAEEVSGTDRGMDIAVPQQEWTLFAAARPAELAALLQRVVRHADLTYYRKAPAQPKKPRKKRSTCQRAKHVATHRLLYPDLYPAKQKKQKSG
jgi:hypothetical protein